MVFTVVDLAWETVKANLDEPTRAEWPWRLTLLDASTCAAIVALLAGVIITRTQLALTMQPVLSWCGFAGGSSVVADSTRTILLSNAGGGRAVVRSAAYRVRTSPQHGGELPPSDADWQDWHATLDSITALGLVRDQDFFLLHLGPGAAIPMTSNAREGLELLALGPRAADVLSTFDIRIQVTDVLGDVHERDLQSLRPPRASAADSGSWNTGE